jgi:hypothetical protein
MGVHIVDEKHGFPRKVLPAVSRQAFKRILTDVILHCRWRVTATAGAQLPAPCRIDDGRFRCWSKIHIKALLTVEGRGLSIQFPGLQSTSMDTVRCLKFTEKRYAKDAQERVHGQGRKSVRLHGRVADRFKRWRKPASDGPSFGKKTVCYPLPRSPGIRYPAFGGLQIGKDFDFPQPVFADISVCFRQALLEAGFDHYGGFFAFGVFGKMGREEIVQFVQIQQRQINFALAEQPDIMIFLKLGGRHQMPDGGNYFPEIDTVRHFDQKVVVSGSDFHPVLLEFSLHHRLSETGCICPHPSLGRGEV